MWYQGGKQAHHATHWPWLHGPAALAGVSLRAKELETSVTLLAVWLGKDFIGLHLELQL